MPVDRYRDVSEMPPPPRPPAEQLLQAIAAVWERAHISLPPEVPRGVHKYTSIEASQRHRRAWELDRIRRLRSQRGSSSRTPGG